MLRTLIIAASLLFAGVCLGGDPAPELIRYEWAVETSPVLTSLPVTAPSQIEARQCARCKALSLEVTADTRFFLAHEHARREVALADLKKYSGNDTLPMGVYYRPDTLQVTRIIVFVANAADLAADRTQR
jgi:hypothetical protein